ncbi:UNVERIFIED_CONTAM: hypothetical protein Sradi_1339100 [Sesamum radiatum]|uniref:DUF8040 domain-containing protein n=1 Tax=Sesamum radiatum TaxID=300843 RepID=A0AAW2UPT9_SESRA
MTKPCFYALVDALTSRGLLPQGQTSRVTSIEEVALFMQTVGMHKRHRDNMERFQHSLETINRRFHRVLSALCAMAPELITPPNFTEPHPRVANNPDFYPFFKDCVGAMDGTLVPAWVPRVDQHRYRSRKGRLAQNVLAICDFDMNFTYVYAGWEEVRPTPVSWTMQYHKIQIFLPADWFSNDDIIFNEPDEDTLIDMDSFYHRGHPTNSEIEAQRTIRDSIAMQMWADKDPN